MLLLCYLIVAASFFVHIDPEAIRELYFLREITIQKLMIFDLYTLLVSVLTDNIYYCYCYSILFCFAFV